MGRAVRFELEWQEAPGVRDKVLAESWARLSLRIGELHATESIDSRSSSRRLGVYGPLFPLAEWLVEHWWHLLHEPSPHSPVLGGRAAPPWMRSWVQRHNLLAARDGGALPDFTIARDGNEAFLYWEADPILHHGPARVRFVSQGKSRVSVNELEGQLSAVIEAVLSRLQEKLQGNEEVERVVAEWDTVRSADADEKELCRLLAIMGVDPYDPDEATDALIGTVERCRDLPESLRTDLLEGSDPNSLSANLGWVERERTDVRPGVNGDAPPSVELVWAPTAHETGYLAARKAREKLLRIPADKPIQNLQETLVERLGWSQQCSRLASSEAQLDGLLELDETEAAPLLVVAYKRNSVAERFRLARAAFFPATRTLGAGARLLTNSAAYSQRMTRAFAAELLAPSEALSKLVSGRLHDTNVEELAEEFEVSPQLIGHQVENHGLGFIES